MFFNDTIKYRQAKSRPFSCRFGSEEGIEDLMKLIGGNSATVVADHDDNGLALNPCLDSHFTFAFNRLGSVYQQVRPHLILLAGVAIHGRQFSVVAGQRYPAPA